MIKIHHLCFSYTKQPFIENLSLNVSKGEIFGFLGPSGAGKSTIQKILIGMINNYSGNVIVNNTEVKKRKNSFYENIGVDFEYPSLYEKLSAKENLDFFASLYSGDKYSSEELLDKVGLLNEANKKAGDFSKGMKSRLNFIKALMHKPKILFLDEPTSGLDPSNSRNMKDLILEQKRLGTTIILTTHNMNDAYELCDRVAFIVDGKIKALDTPHNLIMQKGSSKLVYTFKENDTEKTAEIQMNQLSTDERLSNLIKTNNILTIHSCEPNLGDIFMDITGKKLS